MDQLKAIAVSEGEDATKTIVPLIGKINDLLKGGKFHAAEEAYHLGELENQYLQALAPPAANADLKELKVEVQSCVLAGVSKLQALIGWIMMLVPPIEDGGNFGVGVQLDTLKALKEQADGLTKTLDGFGDYHEKRAGAVEKIAVKTSEEQKVASSSTDAKGGKDGDQVSSSKTNSDSQTKTTPFVTEDQKLAVVAIDLKFYLHLYTSLKSTRNSLLYTFDMIEKNMEKIRKPRTNAGGAPSFMY